MAATASVTRLQAAFVQGAGKPNFDYVGIAMQIGARVYMGHKDKGDESPSSLWNHIQRCVVLINKKCDEFPQITPERRAILVAKTILHEYFELKDANGKRERTHEECWAELRAAGFEDDFIRSLDALSKRAGEFYCDFAQRTAQDVDACFIKRYADLADHANRTDNPINEHSTELFKDKYFYLYNMVGRFFEARLAGWPDSTVAEYIMTSPAVPEDLKRVDVLARNSSPGTIIPAAVATTVHGPAVSRRSFMSGSTGASIAAFLAMPSKTIPTFR